MTLLPIVERELRTASRRGGTYRTRLIVALVAVVLSASIFVVDLGAPAQQVGQFIFRGLSGLLLVYCLFQGRRASADCLSEEKREGTLGLLFLTDLKGHDVVLGKLAATSLGGFYGLMTVFPVLALTLLLGGVSSGEFWRMVLVLINSFLFSLAVGVMSSSLSRDHRRAMAANFFLLLCLAAVPPACASVIAARSPTNLFPSPLLYSCPVYTFVMSFDLAYRVKPLDFWWSLGLIHALVWLLISLASWIVPHTWQDRPSRAGRNLWREFWHWVSFGKKTKQVVFRRRLLEVNAFFWLAGRARLKPFHVWIFLGGIGGWWVTGRIASGPLWLDAGVALTMALLLNTTLKIWVVIEAGQRLAEDQQAGALELILSTPLGVKEIVRGQWLALRRQFLGPLLAVLAVETAWMIYLSPRLRDDDFPVVWLAGMFMLVADVFALGWVAMRAALTAKNHNRATITTFTRILIAPWIGFGLVWALGNAWCLLTSDAPWDLSPKAGIGLWLGWGLAADLLFGLLAWRQLRTHFRQYVVERYAPPPRRLTGWLHRNRPARGLAGTVTADSPPNRNRWSRKRKTAIAALASLVVAGLAWSKWGAGPTYPPPLRVSLTASNTPVSVSLLWGQTMVLVLPDGSLWRWGRNGPVDPRHPVLPQRIGTNQNWIKATTSSGLRWLALRSDGSLWEGERTGNEIGDLVKPVGAGQEWTDVASLGAQTCAIRRDGTLWSWDRTPAGFGPSQIRTVRATRASLTNSAATSTTNPTPASAGAPSRTPRRAGVPMDPASREPEQLGTNHDWTALSSGGSALLGLRANGTLWAWSHYWPAAGPGWAATNAALPIQVCADTNWVALSAMENGLVWNRAGELWEPLVGPPDARAPAVAVGRLIVSNSMPTHVAAAYGIGPDLFQIRTNGTLWRRTFPYSPWASLTDQGWSQVGKRRDWVAISGGGAVAAGLTADGTLWTWGLDFNHQASLSFLTRVQVARARIASIFGAGRRVGMGPFGIAPAYVKDPQPLMKFEPPSRP